MAVAGSFGLTRQALAQHSAHPAATNPDLAARQAQLLEPNPDAVKQAIDAFLDGKTPVDEGLKLDVAALADNPSAVPAKISITRPMTEQNWCEEVILIAEKNPIPLACRLYFFPAAGVAEAAVRIRLAQSQSVLALARMKDGTILRARHAITVAASGCGM